MSRIDSAARIRLVGQVFQLFSIAAYRWSACRLNPFASRFARRVSRHRYAPVELISSNAV